MGGLFHFIFLSFIVGVAANFKNSGYALFQKKTQFWRLDTSIQDEFEELLVKTRDRLTKYDMGIPSEITMHRMENDEKNVFKEPFLIGDSTNLHVYHYVSEPLTNWCSGLVSRSTDSDYEYKNRRIHVKFDCNKTMILPCPKSIIRCVLVGLFAYAAVYVTNMFMFKLTISGGKGDPSSDTKVSKWLTDEEDPEAEATFMERVEKWDNSNLD